MTADARLDAAMNSGLGPDEAADKVMENMTRTEMVTELRPLLVWRARTRARARVRKIEHEYGDVSSPGAVRALVAETFPLPDGGRVAWVTATVDQHRARAGWLRGHARSTVSTAVRHERAASRIEEAGVVCLADLPVEEVA